MLQLPSQGMHCTVSVPELGLELSAATLGGCVLEAKEMLDTIHSQVYLRGVGACVFCAHTD